VRGRDADPPARLPVDPRRGLGLRVVARGDRIEEAPEARRRERDLHELAPGIYLEACRRIGIAPADAVALEDSPTGIRAAKAAWLACVGIPSEMPEALAEADRVVGSLLDLIAPAA
ncbi:MAG: hypothetical protein ACKOTZ_03815, partial [Chloroflexota bacterium]